MEEDFEGGTPEVALAVVVAAVAEEEEAGNAGAYGGVSVEYE